VQGRGAASIRADAPTLCLAVRSPRNTPDEDLPQDPGTSGLASEEPEPEQSLERPEGEDDVSGTDAAGREPRHRAD
jgi:hypothetical protein